MYDDSSQGRWGPEMVSNLVQVQGEFAEHVYCSWGWLSLSSPSFGVRLVCKDSGGCVFRLASESTSVDDGLAGSRPWCKQGLFVTALKHNWRHLSARVEQSEVTSTKCGRYQEQHLFLCVCLSNWKSKLSAAILSSIKLLGFHPIPETSLLVFLSPSCLKDPYRGSVGLLLHHLVVLW